jgi:ABC-type branched-subunit amino acid transport system substrate-binding protein
MNNKLVGILLLIAIIVGGSVIYYNQHSGSGTWIKGNSEDVQKDSNRSNSSQDTSNTPEPRKALIGANPMVLAQTMVSFLKENGSPNLEVNMDAYKKGLDAYNSQKYADALSYLSGIDTDDRDPFLLVLTENSKIMAEESEYVEIAVAGPMTGDSWQKGLAELYGAALAQQEINLAGGISGKKVIVDIADDKGQTGKSTTDTARSIVNSKVLAVVGHIGSANTLAAAPLYEKAGLPAISPSSSSPLVSKAGEFIFRVCSDDNAQGRALVKYALDTGAKQAAIVYMPTDAYSMTLHDAVKKEAGTTGLAINKEYKYQKGAMDFADIAAQIKASGVDSVFFLRQ